MDGMEKVSVKRGMDLLPRIWTMFLTQSDDLWAEPFSNRKLRHRCFFEKSTGISNGLKVYFHLTDEQSNRSLTPLPPTIYFYGAFNEVTVYQVRSFGNIRELTSLEKSRFVKALKLRFAGKPKNDKPVLNLSLLEKAEALKTIESGRFYCFEPLDYYYRTYERG